MTVQPQPPGPVRSLDDELRLAADGDPPPARIDRGGVLQAVQGRDETRPAGSHGPKPNRSVVRCADDVAGVRRKLGVTHVLVPGELAFPPGRRVPDVNT